MEADLKQFISEMIKADRTIAQTADTVKNSTGAVKGLTNAFDVLTGGAIPGLGEMGKYISAARNASMSLNTAWGVLKRQDWMVAARLKMKGYTGEVVAAGVATKSLTASTLAWQSVATLGIGAAVVTASYLYSEYSKIKDEIKAAEEAHKQFQEELVASGRSYAESVTNLIQRYKTEDERAEQQAKLIQNRYDALVRFEKKLAEEKENTLSIERHIAELRDKRAISKNSIERWSLDQRIATLDQMRQESKEDERATQSFIGPNSSSQVLEVQRRFQAELDEKEKKRIEQRDAALKRELELKEQERHREWEAEQRRITDQRKIVDGFRELTLTQEQKSDRDIERYLDAIDALEAAGRAIPSPAELDATIAAIEKSYATKPPSIAEQAGSSLQAMAFRSLDSYQTIRQTQDPNTKLLEESLNEQRITNRRLDESNRLQREQNEMFQSSP